MEKQGNEAGADSPTLGVDEALIDLLVFIIALYVLWFAHPRRAVHPSQ